MTGHGRSHFTVPIRPTIPPSASLIVRHFQACARSTLAQRMTHWDGIRFSRRTPTAVARRISTRGAGRCRYGPMSLLSFLSSEPLNCKGLQHSEKLCSKSRLNDHDLLGQANDSAFARRCYQANILFIDEWVGKILDALTTTAQLENTYVRSEPRTVFLRSDTFSA